jgi:hypothetical protein
MVDPRRVLFGGMNAVHCQAENAGCKAENVG